MTLISIARLSKFVKSKAAVILFAAVLLAPSLSQAQSSGREMDNEDDEPAVQSGSATSGPWGNSAGAAIGSASSTERPTTTADPRLGPGGGAIARPLSGPTPDATGGPGGNPDVPFDTNMNLMFLAGGVVFAYIVYRRRLKVKPLAAEKK